MYKFNRPLFLFFLLLSSCYALSQDDDTFSDTVDASSVKVKATRQRFLAIDRPEPVPVRTIPGEKIKAIKQDESYWYADWAPEKEKEPAPEKSSGKSLFDQPWFKTLLWVLILASFVGAVIWYLASGNIRLFRKEPEKIEAEDDEELTEDIFALNFEKEISKAVGNKNYRLAIRLWYLRTLKELSGKGIIQYGHQKTNSDYLNNLWGGQHYRDFFKLTRNFEYVWYGQFPLTDEGYQMMQTDFSNFKSGLLS